MDLEEGIFRTALLLHKMQQIFGDCHTGNHITLDEDTGRVYAKNDPAETRGHVHLGKNLIL